MVGVGYPVGFGVVDACTGGSLLGFERTLSPPLEHMPPKLRPNLPFLSKFPLLGGFTPSITLQRSSVSSVGDSLPYPELLELLYDIHTRTRNTWKFFTPVPAILGVLVQHCYTRWELL